jgi:hypothetical protein
VLKLFAAAALAGASGKGDSLPALATEGAMVNSTPPSFVGVAVYRVGADGSLDGVWTTSLSLGKGLGRELLTGGTPGQIEGSYACTTYDNQGRIILEATTTISASGPAYAMRWDGTDGSAYDGMGLLQDGSVLAATYWPATG